MRPTDERGARLAREAVADAMQGHRLRYASDLASAAGINVDTASDFINGKRWPNRSTLAKIEEALGMQAGVLDALGRGDESFAERHATRPASTTPGAKTLDEASDIDLLMELLSRAHARLSPPSDESSRSS
jgi:transcriptional regulator with XRE-family HTH domain